MRQKVISGKDILKVLDYIKHNEEYMVMMAEAWLLATAAICYPQEIFYYLKDKADLTLKRKTISKICDSFRFTDETKEKLHYRCFHIATKYSCKTRGDKHINKITFCFLFIHYSPPKLKDNLSESSIVSEYSPKVRPFS